ncbi:phage tail spike protein [Virgibacillus sp. MG-45]|uniref:phage tail spike protein n=1 Tax=Virgibacillus sp. MG-45 TaxID=3102791 RepID=UPI002EDA9CF5
MLYIFDKDDNFITILSKETGLVSTWFKDYENHIPEESFVFNVKKNSPLLKHIAEENQVAFHDRDNKLRLMRIKGLREVSSSRGGFVSYNIQAICEPSFLELYDHLIEDRRFINKLAQNALDGVLLGTRYVGEVTVDLGLATANFYWINGIESLWEIINTWGGSIKDTITLNENNEIIERKIWIVQRLGTDNGLIVEPDYNAEQIERKTLSYIKTALWAQGASLETDNGGYTRYITFENVVWSKANGDPVDKPKGQKWVGDPEALQQYGYLHNGVRKHRFGHFSNQDYDTPEDLLWATWQALQEQKLKEIMHEATIIETDKKVSLGDTVTILDRSYNKPIELQSQITGLEYDILQIKEVKLIVGKFVNMTDPLLKEVEDIKETVKKPRPTKPIDNGSYPDIKPGTPVNVSASGSFQAVQLHWDYDSKVYISHYEVYGSQIMGFVPDSKHLLYRGRASGFDHKVNTDEVWYYKIRSVNTRGTPGDFSVQVSASTVRIITDDILFGSITKELIADLAVDAEKLADGSVTVTKIANLAVGNAAIQNLAVSRAKIGTAAVGTLQIEDGSITNAKVHDLSADKINAGVIRGIDIYGSKFRSSAGTDWMEIIGGNIKLTKSNAQYVNISPDGIYGYNGSGSVRFRADELLVTSAALGTTYSNAYVAPADGYEVRIVRVNEVPSDGAPGSYVYRPIRALGLRFGPNANGYIGTDGEVRITSLGFAESGSVIFRPLRAANIYGTAFTTTTTSLWMGTDSVMHVVNKGYVEGTTGNPIYRDIYAAQIRGYSFVTQSANAYIGCDGELRVVNKGLSDIYRDVRLQTLHAQGSVIANGNYTAGNNGVFMSNGGYVVVRAAAGIVYLQTDYHVRATKPGQASTFVEIRADKFTAQSTIDSKQDITKWTGSALDIINNSVIYQYRKITDVESGITKLRYGYVIGAGYQTPYEVLNHDQTGVDQYQMNSLNTKAIQELSELVNINVDDINWLKMENQLLKARVDKLEGVA